MVYGLWFRPEFRGYVVSALIGCWVSAQGKTSEFQHMERPQELENTLKSSEGKSLPSRAVASPCAVGEAQCRFAKPSCQLRFLFARTATASPPRCLDSSNALRAEQDGRRTFKIVSRWHCSTHIVYYHLLATWDLCCSCPASQVSSIPAPDAHTHFAIAARQSPLFIRPHRRDIHPSGFLKVNRDHHSVDNRDVTARAGVVEMEKINHRYRAAAITNHALSIMLWWCSEIIVVIMSV